MKNNNTKNGKKNTQINLIGQNIPSIVEDSQKGSNGGDIFNDSI